MGMRQMSVPVDGDEFCFGDEDGNRDDKPTCHHMSIFRIHLSFNKKSP